MYCTLLYEQRLLVQPDALSETGIRRPGIEILIKDYSKKVINLEA